MDLRDTVFALAALGATPWAAQAQPAGKVYRIGYLSAPSRASVESVVQAFLRGLRDSMFLAHKERFAALALKNRLPTMYSHREGVEAGGLRAYWVNMADFVGRSATYVDKILKGAKPADMPVEQPTRFELVINLKTAKALGLNISKDVLLRTDEVIR
jgi:putative tryptophan/tyrosine transport system substrate-binding protein